MELQWQIVCKDRDLLWELCIRIYFKEIIGAVEGLQSYLQTGCKWDEPMGQVRNGRRETRCQVTGERGGAAEPFHKAYHHRRSLGLHKAGQSQGVNEVLLSR